MALKVFVIDDALGTCDLREMVPYTNVTSNDGTVVVTGTTDPVTGQPMYDLSAAVDVNVNNFSYNSVTKEITLTETDGDTYTIDISDLVDVAAAETVTTLVSDGTGGFNYTSEDGTVTNIPAAISTVTNVDNGDNTSIVTDSSNDTSCFPHCPESLKSAPDCVSHVMEFDSSGTPTGNVIPIDVEKAVAFDTAWGKQLVSESIVYDNSADGSVSAGSYTTDFTIANIAALVPEFDPLCHNALEVMVYTQVSVAYRGDSLITGQQRRADTDVGNTYPLRAMANGINHEGTQDAASDLNRGELVGWVDLNGASLPVTIAWQGLARDADDRVVITHRVYARTVGRKNRYF